MALNLWFEHHVDAYLRACAEGRDWREAVKEAERSIGDKPRRVLDREALKTQKGIGYSRQHLQKKIRDHDFPKPFQVPSTPDPDKPETDTTVNGEAPHRGTASIGPLTADQDGNFW